MIKEKIVIFGIPFLTCIIIGYFVSFTLQYIYYSCCDTIFDVNVILYGGFLLGCLFYIPIFTVIMLEVKTCTKK